MISLDKNANVSCGSTGNTTWYFPAGALIAAYVILTVLRPPILVVLLLDAAVLAVNGYVVQYAGGLRNVPTWVLFVCLLQVLVTIQHVAIMLRLI